MKVSRRFCLFSNLLLLLDRSRFLSKLCLSIVRGDVDRDFERDFVRALKTLFEGWPFIRSLDNDRLGLLCGGDFVRLNVEIDLLLILDCDLRRLRECRGEIDLRRLEFDRFLDNERLLCGEFNDLLRLPRLLEPRLRGERTGDRDLGGREVSLPYLSLKVLGWRSAIRFLTS